MTCFVCLPFTHSPLQGQKQQDCFSQEKFQTLGDVKDLEHMSLQVPNTTFPSVPALPDSLFSSCYAAKLEGYVRVDNYTDLQFLTPEPVPKFYNSYRYTISHSYAAVVCEACRE